MDCYHFSAYNTEDFLTDEVFLELASRGASSIEELKEQFPNKSEAIDLAYEILNQLQRPEFQQLPEKKLEQWNHLLNNQKKSIRLSWLKVAASFLLIMGIGSLSFLFFGPNPSIENFAEKTTVNFQNTELILADGQHVGISKKQSNVKYSTDGAGIVVNDSTKMKQKVEEGKFNQLIVPHGKRSSITLSDGTKVWVNSGSRLVFLPVFKAHIREVYLEGEAYFEVAKDVRKPFYVRTDAYKVKVYGTKFDVQAYKEDNEYNTILVEGKVSLEVKKSGLHSKEHFLLPNHKASVTEGKDEILITEVFNIDNYTAWKDGYLIFKNESFPDLLKRVSHYYNIPIEANIQSGIKQVSGKLDLKDNPERVLDGLSAISKSRYVKRENKYIFYE